MQDTNDITGETIDLCVCDERNPLERDGTSQGQRLLAGLLPGHVAVDERKLEDLLLFASRLAEKLKFFGSDNTPDGDWKNFITRDVTTLVAEMSTFDPSRERKQMQQLVEGIDKALKEDPDAEIDPLNLHTLFEKSLALLSTISGWYERSDKSLLLHRDLDLVFKSVFVTNIRRLAGIDKASDDKLGSPLHLAIAGIGDVLNEDWKKYLLQSTVIGEINGEIDWENDTTVPALDEVFAVDGGEEQKLRSAARYMHGLYEQQVNAVLGITQKRAMYLDETLNNYPYHKAHIGLFIAFLQVFAHAQQHMNGLTARHLDYYYERILGLERREAIPDKAHVIFELAKNVTEFLVPEGTKLNAGKDGTGVQVAFGTCDDIIVNKAQAVLFRNVVIDKRGDDYYGIFAANKADSSDGNGGELDAKSPQWNAFGESQYGKMPLKRTLPEARIGFAIASPQLILNEGTRTITLTFKLESFLGSDEVKEFAYQFTNHPEALRCKLTGAKGWFEPKAIKSLLFDDKKENEGEGTSFDPWFKDYYYYKPGDPNYPVTGPYSDPVYGGIYYPDAAAVQPPAGPDPYEFKMVLVIELDETQEAIVSYNAAVHGGSYTTSYPVLALELPNFADLDKNTITESSTAAEKETFAEEGTKATQNFYELFKTLTIRGGKINVKVQGVRNIIVQNDQAKLDPNKPFQPFGVTPSVGSSFYIGSPEVFYKKLRNLTIHTEWHELPPDFGKHYEVYGKALGWPITTESKKELEKNGKALTIYDSPPGINDATDFKANIEYLVDRQWKLLDKFKESPSTLTDRLTLLKKGASSISYAISPAENDDELEWISNATRVTDIVPFNEYTRDVQRGFIRLVLRDIDFKHRDYPAVLTKVAFASSDPNDSSGLKGEIVKAPYTPLIKSISIDYESEQQLKQNVDRLFHLHPFGEAEVSVDPNLNVKLLPQFTLFEMQEDDATGKKVPVEYPKGKDPAEQQSMFFIGLENAKPGSSISMLVQVVEDSGDPDITRPTVNWSYLLGNKWIKLEPSQVVSDTTNGFINSGIVELALPADATSNNTILPSGYHWFCASVENNYEALCNLFAIKTQAVCAEFADNGNDPNRLSEALEAGKISKLLNSIPQIKSVKQPYASFGGRMAEQSNEFYRRASERLRHKGRAIAVWDYERLVLESFPSVYKVKCINHTSRSCNSELAPGSVCVTVVSNLRNQNQVDKFRPTTSIATLEEIKRLLRQRTSRFVNIEVINPEFEALQVSFKVAFGKQYAADSGYYQNLLEEEIRRYLSPWAYDGGHDITFGGKIHGSSIIDFVEERPYVEYIKDFEFYAYDDELGQKKGDSVEEIVASTARSILVSAKTHVITPI